MECSGRSGVHSVLPNMGVPHLPKILENERTLIKTNRNPCITMVT